MKIFGLVGYPLSHSYSPKLHEIIAQEKGVFLEYKLFPIKEIKQIETIISKLKRHEIYGFNVTIPYKESIMPYLDVISDKALKIKAVNTVYLKDGKVYGDNTDYDGFKGLLDQNMIDLSNKKVIILGSGGASKAVYQVLMDLAIEPIVVSRTKIVDQAFKHIMLYEDLKASDYDVIINTTPVGMYPLVDQSPLEAKYVKDKLVIDLIYNPKETKLMHDGKNSFNGLDMLIIQAMVAENIWFNQKDIQKLIGFKEIREAFDEYLRKTI